jgi:RNA polymerase sigma-70 factor, ECF subfamily
VARVLARGAAREDSSDEALVKRIARGDKLAMQALFARHRTSIYRWLVRFVSDTTLAEDLLSEVFLDVWRQANRFEGRSSVSTWLISIARFKALSARRRRIDAELDEKIEATVADPADDPETALQKKDRGELLRLALARLSPEHQEIIELVRGLAAAGPPLPLPSVRKLNFRACPAHSHRAHRANGSQP